MNGKVMTTDEMRRIVEENLPEVLEKDSGIFEFYEDGRISLGVSFEDLEQFEGVVCKDVYIFNLFVDGEYVNIEGEYRRNEDSAFIPVEGVGRDLYSALSDAWNEVISLDERKYLKGVGVRDLVESDAGKCEGLNFQFMLDEGYKVLECGDLYAIISKSDYEGFGRERICDAVYMEHSDVLEQDFLKVDFERIANDPEFNKPMEVEVSFVRDLPGAGEALYRSETGKHYIRQDNARERCAVWLSAFKYKGDWTDNAPIRPNVTFAMGNEREKVSYSNWAGSGVWGEDYNERFAKPSLDMIIESAERGKVSSAKDIDINLDEPSL